MPPVVRMWGEDQKVDCRQLRGGFNPLRGPSAARRGTIAILGQVRWITSAFLQTHHRYGTTLPMTHKHTPDEERRIREAALDHTIEDTFPASDPPSTLPNPDGDEMIDDLEEAEEPARGKRPRGPAGH